MQESKRESKRGFLKCPEYQVSSRYPSTSASMEREENAICFLEKVAGL